MKRSSAFATVSLALTLTSCVTDSSSASTSSSSSQIGTTSSSISSATVSSSSVRKSSLAISSSSAATARSSATQGNTLIITPTPQVVTTGTWTLTYSGCSGTLLVTAAPNSCAIDIGQISMSNIESYSFSPGPSSAAITGSCNLYCQ